MKKKLTNQLTLLYFKSKFLNSLPNVGTSSHFEIGHLADISAPVVGAKCTKNASHQLALLNYKPYNHVDRTVLIADSFASKCLFPQTDLIELD